FVRGGAESHAEGLRRALQAHGHEADVVTLPFWREPPGELGHMIDSWARLRPRHWWVAPDRVIALKFPAWLCDHADLRIWMLHQYREAWDQLDRPRYERDADFRAATDRVREITITTKGEGKVNLSSVAVHNRQFGLSYNNVGFPGATVDIVNKFDDAILDNELKRLDPQIVVLAFGTNEGFNDGLDPAVYERSYERALNKIRRALPDAKIVIVAPPDAARGPKKDPEKNAKTNGDTKDTPEKKADGEKKQAPPVAEASEKNGCNQWKTPPQLNKVREVQEIIAKRHGLVYWNWASIMPSECAADRWANASPPLLAKDRVHFTLEGYRRSAAQFLKALEPLIEQVRKANDVVSNH
ncbi:MAG TPA: GDSL-type esterase/lipase family protein, partial [Xanthobacteraceae bacterium]|nr:GDSL-type esterase/lipase family protein [Xanthobacteraceae bacterium]